MKMEFDLTNPLLQRHQSSVQALIQKYFDLEVEFMVAPGYSRQQHFIIIRTIAISDIEKYSSDQVDAFVPFLAVTFVDRFLSRNINIPVVERGEGFAHNLKLFVFCCVSIACKIRCSDFSFRDFLDKHQVAEVKRVVVMELQILEGLQWRVRPVTAITFMYFLLPLFKTDDQQQTLRSTPVSQILVAVQKDIRFTEFRPSSLAASALLATSYRLIPERHSEFVRKIFNCGFIEKFEVEQCFDAMKKHTLVDYVLNPDNRPRVFKEKYRWGIRRYKGKEQLIEDSAVESVAQPDQIPVVTNDEEEPEIVMEFDLNWHEIEPEPVEEERYGPMQQLLNCFWPVACRCFGYEFTRPN